MGIRARLRQHFHSARAKLCVELLQLAPHSRILDLGGGDGSFAALIHELIPVEVTVADIAADTAPAVTARGFRHVLLADGAPLPFPPGTFDAVICNSVIEHATLPKERCRTSARVPEREWVAAATAEQVAFAAMIRETAPAYFVQTPHRNFPIEQHVHLPLVQYLPHNAQCRVVHYTDRYWIKSCQGVVDWHLLSPRDMKTLFPDATMVVERWCALPKSIIAFRRGVAGASGGDNARDH